MDVKDIKKEVEQLADVEDLLSNFTRLWFRPVRKWTHQTFQPQLEALHYAIEQAKYGQIINQKLKSLTDYLIELRVSALTNDQRTRQQAIHRFLRDPFLQLFQVIEEVREYEQQVNQLNLLYNEIHQQVLPILPLEQRIALLDSTHPFALRMLSVTVSKQKKLLTQIGRQFVTEMRKSQRKA
jgi:hypothetical protein